MFTYCVFSDQKCNDNTDRCVSKLLCATYGQLHAFFHFIDNAQPDKNIAKVTAHSNYHV